MAKMISKAQTQVALPEWLASRGWVSATKTPALRGQEAIDAVKAGTHQVCLKHDQHGWMTAPHGTAASKQTVCWIDRTAEYQAATGARYALMNALQYIGAEVHQ